MSAMRVRVTRDPVGMFTKGSNSVNTLMTREVLYRAPVCRKCGDALKVWTSGGPRVCQACAPKPKPAKAAKHTRSRRVATLTVTHVDPEVQRAATVARKASELAQVPETLRNYSKIPKAMRPAVQDAVRELDTLRNAA